MRTVGTLARCGAGGARPSRVLHGGTTSACLSARGRTQTGVVRGLFQRNRHLTSRGPPVDAASVSATRGRARTATGRRGSGDRFISCSPRPRADSLFFKQDP